MDDHPIPRFLKTSYTSTYTDDGNGTVCHADNKCFCKPWLDTRGSSTEKAIANALQWFAFALCVIILCWYAYHSWKATCGWEEVYVCCIELVKVVIEFFHEFNSPAMLYLSTGNRVLLIRYGEWLLTCPVILIHLSNLTGLKDDYSKRTMRLLVSDIGTIVFGVTSACSTGYLKIVFFLLGLLYGCNTYFHAAKVYVESYHMLPKGHCRVVIRLMAWIFFLSWAMFPILFVLGPEGFGHLTFYGSTIGHTIVDILSKNVWGFLGHHLRVKIHEHILIHGDIRKKTKIRVAGEEMEVETLMEQEDEDTVKKPTAAYASRESFVVMRDRLKEKGFEVRASLDGPMPNEHMANNTHTMMGGNKGGYDMGGKSMQMGSMQMMGSMKGGPAVEPGRVILAVPDISMVDFFREQFAGLPVAMELVPALGPENTLQLVQQAMGLGGCDFVLLHPEFVRDRSPNGLVSRLRNMGQRTAAFGWAQVGPMRDLIDSSGVDAHLEGPSFGAGISPQNLLELIAMMQQAKKQGGMMMGGIGVGSMNAGMMGGMNAGMMGSMNAGMGSGMGSPMGGMGMAQGGMNQSSRMMSMGMGGAGNNNPLYGTAPSPLSSQPGMAAGAVPVVSPQAGGGSEAEMLQQLMSEINRLKSELGEQH